MRRLVQKTRNFVVKQAGLFMNAITNAKQESGEITISIVIGVIIGIFIIRPVIFICASIRNSFLWSKNMIHIRMNLHYKEENHLYDFHMCNKKICIYKNTYINEVGFAVSAVFGTPFTRFRRVFKICVDEKFMQMPEYAQKFIAAHEAAHILNKDLSMKSIRNMKKIYSNAMVQGLNNDEASMAIAIRQIEMEYTADTLAASYLGYNNSLEAMALLYHMIPQKEIVLRYQNLGGDPNTLVHPIEWIIKSMNVKEVRLEDLE